MRGFSLLLLPALLTAQRPPASPAAAFDRELKRNRFGTWLVLEDEGAAWGAGLRAALDEEPVVLLNLPLKVVAGGKKPDALAAVLRERYGWSKGAHWALVDARGQALAEGAAAPTAAGVVRAVEQAGLGSRSQELEAFLRQHPDRVDARFALVRESLQVAARRTRKALPPEPPGSDPAQPKAPPRPLDPEQDLKIWAGAAQHLDALLRETAGLPGISNFMLSRDFQRSLLEHSPTMTALLARHRGTQEAALQRNPDDDGAWMLWAAASKVCGGWPLQPLLAGMQPLPGTPPGSWPPEAALRLYLEDAKARSDWTAIREVLEPKWGALRDRLLDGLLEFGNNRGLWDWILGPLLEAQVAQGDVGAADALLSEAAEASPWPGLPGKARELATRLNRPDLAARWGALSVKGR